MRSAALMVSVRDCAEKSDCLILDIIMPAMSGLELQAELAGRHNAVPIVFITSATDERLTATALERGAVACIFKPFSEAAILGAVEGLTEFLPISSTAHLILTSQFLGLAQTEFQKFFEVFIQLGAVLAVLFLYVKYLFSQKEIIKN